jgi:hypothetical protein
MTGRVGRAQCRSGGFGEDKSEKKNLKLRSGQNKIISSGRQTAIILFLKFVYQCLCALKKMQNYRIPPSTFFLKVNIITQRVALTNILAFRLMTEQIY